MTLPAERTAEAHDDLLTALLSPLRLRGVFASWWSVRAPWGIRGTAESCALLHYVHSGELAVTFPGTAGTSETAETAEPAEPVWVRAGELALFPHGTGHELADRPGRALMPLDLVLPDRPAGATTVVELDGPGAATELLCGGLHYEAAAAPAIYQSLPDILLIDQPTIANEPLLGTVLGELATMTNSTTSAATLVAQRAFELVFVLALRVAVAELGPGEPALQAMRHPGIARALLAIHSRFAETWTLEALAQEAHMSRSAFAATFRSLVGATPARYLTRRRMQEAARLLTETTLALSALPERVGYRSPVGFHLAFRTHFGTTPAQFRHRPVAGEVT